MGDNKRSGMIIVIGAIVALVGTMLELATVAIDSLGISETQNYISSEDGKLVAGIAVIILVFGLLVMMGKALRAASITSAVFSVILLIVVAIDYTSIADAKDEVISQLGSDPGVTASAGLGIYIALLGTLVALVGSIMALRSRGGADVGAPPAMGSPGMGAGGMAPPPGGMAPPPGGMAPPPGGMAPPPSSGGMPPTGGMPPPAGGMPSGQGYPPPNDPSGPSV